MGVWLYVYLYMLESEPTHNNTNHRHWDQLSQHCCPPAASKQPGSGIDPTSPKFTFEDMMRYRLHEHKEVVEELVATATKELKIENQLEVIVRTWVGGLQLDYAPHKDTEMVVIKPVRTFVYMCV